MVETAGTSDALYGICGRGNVRNSLVSREAAQDDIIPARAKITRVQNSLDEWISALSILRPRPPSQTFNKL